jgi:hypothetical protein
MSSLQGAISLGGATAPSAINCLRRLELHGWLDPATAAQVHVGVPIPCPIHEIWSVTGWTQLHKKDRLIWADVKFALMKGKGRFELPR